MPIWIAKEVYLETRLELKYFCTYGHHTSAVWYNYSDSYMWCVICLGHTNSLKYHYAF